MPFLLLALLLFSFLPGCGRSACAFPVFEAQGHRGARAARPEDTLPAFEYAISRGVTTLELDVAVTRDNVVVVSHDPVLLSSLCVDGNGQPADNVAIRSLTLQELRRYDCGSIQHKDFPNQQTVPGTPPPMLSEVFAMAEQRTGGKIHYSVEPKMDPATDDITPSAEEFVRLVVREIDRAGVGDRVIIQSFDPRPLNVLHAQNSPLHRSLLWPSTSVRIHGRWFLENPVEIATSVGADILSPYAPLTNPALIALAHARGMAIIPWTENKPARIKTLMDQGVDGLISDDVDELMKQVAANHPRGGMCL
jgi:glycerophosphoryl diester phosphodiesterase